MIIEIIITFLMAFCISITLSYKKFFDKVARNLNQLLTNELCKLNYN